MVIDFKDRSEEIKKKIRNNHKFDRAELQLLQIAVDKDHEAHEAWRALEEYLKKRDE